MTFPEALAMVKRVCLPPRLLTKSPGWPCTPGALYKPLQSIESEAFHNHAVSFCSLSENRRLDLKDQKGNFTDILDRKGGGGSEAAEDRTVVSFIYL